MIGYEEPSVDGKLGHYCSDLFVEGDQFGRVCVHTIVECGAIETDIRERTGDCWERGSYTDRVEPNVRVVAGLVSNLLAGFGFDTMLAKAGIGSSRADDEVKISTIVGKLALVAIMMFATIEAVRMLGFDMLAGLVAEFMVFAGHVGLGLIIFGVGLYLAQLAARTVESSSTPQAGLLAIASRVSILVLAGAMALRQMGLANEIITLAFGLLLGAVAVATALAFGLGGRDLAAETLREWSEKTKKS